MKYIAFQCKQKILCSSCIRECTGTKIYTHTSNYFTIHDKTRQIRRSHFKIGSERFCSLSTITAEAVTKLMSWFFLPCIRYVVSYLYILYLYWHFLLLLLLLHLKNIDFLVFRIYFGSWVVHITTHIHGYDNVSISINQTVTRYTMNVYSMCYTICMLAFAKALI